MQTFGILKKTWGILDKRTEHKKFWKVLDTWVCLITHNMIIRFRQQLEQAAAGSANVAELTAEFEQHLQEVDDGIPPITIATLRRDASSSGTQVMPAVTQSQADGVSVISRRHGGQQSQASKDRAALKRRDDVADQIWEHRSAKRGNKRSRLAA